MSYDGYTREKRRREDSRERVSDRRDDKYGGDRGRGNRDRGGYGGPGGRDFGGRGGPGRGPGRGGPKHMGELENVKRLLNMPAMSDKAMINIISSVGTDMNRPVRRAFLPPAENWRLDSPVGLNLDMSTGAIKVNAYRMTLENIPDLIYPYHIEIRRIKKNSPLPLDEEEDLTNKSANDNMCLNIVYNMLMDSMRVNPANVAYDGRHQLYSIVSLYSKTKIPANCTLVPKDDSSEDTSEVSGSADQSKGDSSTTTVTYYRGTCQCRVSAKSAGEFLVTLKQLDNISLKNSLVNATHIPEKVAESIRILDIALLSFARWESIKPSQQWFVDGNKVFRSSSDLIRLQNVAGLNAMKGYSSAVKLCRSGLTLFTDLAVSVFVQGGPMINVMAAFAQYQSPERMIEDFRRGGIPKGFLKELTQKLKKIRVNFLHLKMTKIVKSVIGAADEEKFESREHGLISVARYYEITCASKPTAAFIEAMPKGCLKYPFMPCINTGTEKRPCYFPIELVLVAPGQIRPVDSTTQASIVRIAAISADERYRYITDDQMGLPSVVREEEICQSFGLSTIFNAPMYVGAKLLPPAKLQYGRNKVIEPGLAGLWYTYDAEFFRPSKEASSTKYGIIILDGDRRDEPAIDSYRQTLERESIKVGMNLELGARPIIIPGDNYELNNALKTLQTNKAAFALVVMCKEAYAMIKLVSAETLMPTQVVKIDRVRNPPKGVHTNLLLKINAKIGGLNHVLASRNPSAPPLASVTNPIPSAVSWIFDKQKTMVVGIDFSDTIKSYDDSKSVGSGGASKKENKAVSAYMGIVASLDPHAARYGAYLCAPEVGRHFDEICTGIHELIGAYYRENKSFPENILVFRDGISDSEFQFIDREVDAIKKAFDEFQSGLHVRITVVMCIKRHRLRFFYEERKSDGTSTYHNPCPGVCLDGTANAEDSVTGEEYIEFYLNSHSPIQGTCKPCRYVVVHDEIGFKVSEIELITYWLCYMYVRCNRSVSYPAPAYYSHWASRRARLLGSSLPATDPATGRAVPPNIPLMDLSEKWIRGNTKQAMFFA